MSLIISALEPIFGDGKSSVGSHETSLAQGTSRSCGCGGNSDLPILLAAIAAATFFLQMVITMNARRRRRRKRHVLEEDTDASAASGREETVQSLHSQVSDALWHGMQSWDLDTDSGDQYLIDASWSSETNETPEVTRKRLF